ncbi:MAG: Ig-like domain-containing protein [Rikenellaceae bacterium]
MEWSLDDVDSTGSTISTTDTGGCSFKAGSNVGVVVLSVTLTDSDDNSTVYSDKVTITIYGDSMEMSDPTLNLSLTETKEISVTISPENSDAVVVWTSSDESVVAVAADSEDNTKATVTVNGSGSATITAAYGTATATCDVMVDYLAVTSVVIDTPVSTTLNAGETIVLTSSVNENANPSVVWSIASGDTTASSIDATTGEFTAGAYKGDVTVVATSTADGSKFGELTLTVNVPVMDVSLNYNSYALSLTGTLNTIKLEAIFSNNPTNQNVTWSTGDLSVAMVVDGLVTAVASGSATITATTVDGAYTAICLITVVDGSVVAATKVVLNTTTASLILDSANSSTEALIATVQDASGSSATNQFVTWSSSNESVVTVDESGNVKATGAGSATITVTSGDGGYTATCAVTVSYATITAVAIDQDDNTVVGSAATLQLTYTPVSDGTFDPTTAAAVWSIISDTSGTGSTIDSSTGVFTAGVAAAGSVSVQVSYAGKTDTVTLDVEEKRDVTSIALDIDTLTLAVGSSYTFTVGVLPDNATYTEYTYSQSGTGSVSIEGDKITAVTAGTVTLTVTSDDPSVTVVDTCTITIKNGLDIDDLVDGGSFFN